MAFIEVRRLTQSGIEKFRELSWEARRQFKARSGEKAIQEIDAWSLSEAEKLLYDDDYSTTVEARKIKVNDAKPFSTQYELAQHLYTVFTYELRVNAWKKEAVGLWEWIAILYASQFRRAAEHYTGGKRYVPIFAKEDVYWIKDDRDAYVHNVFGCFAIFAMLQTKPDVCRKILSSPLGIYPDAYRELCKRQWVISCTSIVDLAIRLYWNDSEGKWKSGIARDAKGGVRRLCEVLAQFEYTYDLYSLTADQLWEMLPAEFDDFKRTSLSEPAER